MLAALAPTPAVAGAWIAPEGGQTIWTEVAGARDERFFSESSYYIEKPISRRASFVAAPWMTQDPDITGFDGLRWEVTLGTKSAITRGAHSTTALQAGLVWLSDPPPPCAEAAAELRWLGGRSFGDADRAFVNVEAAGRWSEGGCGGARGELTLGYRPAGNWLAMTQIFVDQPGLGESTIKGQISVIRFGAEGRGLQIGVRARLDGGDAEPALVLGFWGSGR